MGVATYLRGVYNMGTRISVQCFRVRSGPVTPRHVRIRISDFRYRHPNRKGSFVDIGIVSVKFTLTNAPLNKNPKRYSETAKTCLHLTKVSSFMNHDSLSLS